ncbi:MAG: DUF4922 domain-containing protein [Tannerellaceae bacterium]
MKPNVWVSSTQVTEMLAKQLATWPLAAANFHSLEEVQTRSFDMNGFTVRVQFNPARIVSSAAKVDSNSIRARRCFLCPDNLPMEQERLSFGSHYLVLCNPFPIFPEHFTIPSRRHADQVILPRLEDLLELSRRLDAFTLFYNGPRCGASAPDHAHFQAGTRSFMPIDDEVDEQVRKFGSLVLSEKEGSLYTLTHYLRNGFVIKAVTLSAAVALFHRVYAALEVKEGESEPMMNLFCNYGQEGWRLIIIPRRQHRPWQYAATGVDHLLTSPGAADVGGLFITPLEEDFRKLSPELLRDVYRQVCLGDAEIEEIAISIKRQSE